MTTNGNSHSSLAILKQIASQDQGYTFGVPVAIDGITIIPIRRALTFRSYRLPAVGELGAAVVRNPGNDLVLVPKGIRTSNGEYSASDYWLLPRTGRANISPAFTADLPRLRVVEGQVGMVAIGERMRIVDVFDSVDSWTEVSELKQGEPLDGRAPRTLMLSARELLLEPYECQLKFKHSAKDKDDVALKVYAIKGNLFQGVMAEVDGQVAHVRVGTL